MRRNFIFFIMIAVLAACTQGVVQAPIAAPSPTPSPLPSPTMQLEPSATVIPTLTVAPPCIPIKIMPLGDSITYGAGIVGYGGYRNLLGALLESDGVQFDFVGSQISGEEALADPDNEGHSGWRISDLQAAIAAEGWLETYQPDIILLHIGSNDMVSSNNQLNINLAAASENLSALLDDILIRLPEAHVIVARIIRTRWGSDVSHVYYNDAVSDIAASKGARVSVVDMQDILSKGDFVNLYHPNPRGYDKMAHAWRTAILALNLGKCAVP